MKLVWEGPRYPEKTLYLEDYPMYLTRQDHIDPLVRDVRRNDGACGGTIVYFNTEGYIKGVDYPWTCSCGHGSRDDVIPNLRRPDLDPVRWVQEHPLEIAKSMNIYVCPDHEQPDPYAVEWGMDGHLWFEGHHKTLTLCLPKTIERQRL